MSGTVSLADARSSSYHHLHYHFRAASWLVEEILFLIAFI